MTADTSRRCQRCGCRLWLSAESARTGLCNRHRRLTVALTHTQRQLVEDNAALVTWFLGRNRSLIPRGTWEDAHQHLLLTLCQCVRTWQGRGAFSTYCRAAFTHALQRWHSLLGKEVDRHE